jgi:DNA polymerase-3 subunit delta'
MLHGHDPQIKQLNVLLSKKSVPHALLFVGPNGIGKRTVAKCFAEQLLSEGNEISRDIHTAGHPDLHILSREAGKKDIPVDSVRNLCTSLQLKPYYGKAAVAIIDECERLSPAASNALLTTLEEPVPGRYLILTTENPQKLLPTIRSRCQALLFSGLSKEELRSILSTQLPSSIEIDAALRLCDASLEGLHLELLADDKPKTLEKHLAKIIIDYNEIADRIEEKLKP